MMHFIIDAESLRQMRCLDYRCDASLNSDIPTQIVRCFIDNPGNVVSETTRRILRSHQRNG